MKKIEGWNEPRKPSESKRLVFSPYSCAILTVAQRGSAVSTLLKSQELMYMEIERWCGYFCAAVATLSCQDSKHRWKNSFEPSVTLSGVRCLLGS